MVSFLLGDVCEFIVVVGIRVSILLLVLEYMLVIFNIWYLVNGIMVVVVSF